MSRQISSAGEGLIKGEEQLRLRTYDDRTSRPMYEGDIARGTPSIGWGNTRRALPIREITAAEAQAYFVEDVAEAIRTIYRHVPAHVIEAMPQACWDALVSFIFNTGPQAFITPKGKRTDFWRAVVENPDRLEVARQMQRWVKSGGIVMAGLVKRRGNEAALWGAGVTQGEPRQGTRTAIEEIEQGSRVTPDAPKHAPAMSKTETAAAVTAGTGGVALVSQTITSTGQGLLYSGDKLATIGVVLVIIGLIVTLVLAMRAKR